MSLTSSSIGELSLTEDFQSLTAGSVSVGAPTTTTIPGISATAPTGGYAPYGPYQWAYSLHNAGIWTNFGTNSLTGQTLTGLTAATAYDIRIAQPDDTGFTVYAYALNVTTASGGGSVSELNAYPMAIPMGPVSPRIFGG